MRISPVSHNSTLVPDTTYTALRPETDRKDIILRNMIIIVTSGKR
jgi:hypothetical protein